MTNRSKQSYDGQYGNVMKTVSTKKAKKIKRTKRELLSAGIAGRVVQRQIALIVVTAMIFALGGASFTFAAGTVKVKSINHKGYNTVAPENTLPAYELSKVYGFDYVETDISFTKDGIPVLLHKATIGHMARHEDGSTLTEEENKKIGDLTYDETLQYDFTQGKAAYKGTKLAKMADFLDLCSSKGLHPYLELKQNGDYSRGQIEQLTELVRNHGMGGKVTWISYSKKFLLWLKEKDPKARLGLVCIAADEATMKGLIKDAKELRTGSNYVFLDLCVSVHIKPFAALCKNAGMPLEIWNMFFDEKQVLEDLDPYITGVTSDKYQYAAPDKITLSATSYIYDGNEKKPGVTATWGGNTLAEGKTCKVTYDEDCSSAGSHTVKVSLIDKTYAGASTASYTIQKAANPLSVNGRTVKLKYKKLKRKSHKLTAARVIKFRKKGQGTITYKLTGVKKAKYKKYFKVSAKNGKVSVKKGLRKGVYRLTISVKAAENKNYKASGARRSITKIVVR